MTAEQAHLVVTHEPLVYELAGKMIRRVPRQVELDDLLQEARVGLVQAALTWDPSRGVAFGAFARRRVTGALLDYLRGAYQVSGCRRAASAVWVDQLSVLEASGEADGLPFGRTDTGCAVVDARVDAGRLLSRLTPRRRLTLVAWMRGVPMAVLARRGGVAEATVWLRRRTALERLREVMAA
jgi:RNA polymerase sigma factor (sigma-70 family)